MTIQSNVFPSAPPFPRPVHAMGFFTFNGMAAFWAWQVGFLGDPVTVSAGRFAFRLEVPLPGPATGFGAGISVELQSTGVYAVDPSYFLIRSIEAPGAGESFRLAVMSIQTGLPTSPPGAWVTVLDRF
jgi:hypothetical protein